MATLTIRNLPDHVRDAMRREAAAHNRSMEEEARSSLAERYAPKAPLEEILRKIDELSAKTPQLPAGAKMDKTDAFIASKRIDLLFEEGLIPLGEKQAWDEHIDNYTVSLPEVQVFFEKMWPWTPKS